ncbi:MAG: hypothetical protein DRH32_08220 [Deltaproteobacteria bacterium]|nr:MAG: hypothetical protein DRH32_08220 [Deltaproteobacteria bacterium]
MEPPCFLDVGSVIKAPSGMEGVRRDYKGKHGKKQQGKNMPVCCRCSCVPHTNLPAKLKFSRQQARIKKI